MKKMKSPLEYQVLLSEILPMYTNLILLLDFVKRKKKTRDYQNNYKFFTVRMNGELSKKQNIIMLLILQCL